jgi:hypothetical protein
MLAWALVGRVVVYLRRRRLMWVDVRCRWVLRLVPDLYRDAGPWLGRGPCWVCRGLGSGGPRPRARAGGVGRMWSIVGGVIDPGRAGCQVAGGRLYLVVSLGICLPCQVMPVVVFVVVVGVVHCVVCRGLGGCL